MKSGINLSDVIWSRKKRIKKQEQNDYQVFSFKTKKSNTNIKLNLTHLHSFLWHKLNHLHLYQFHHQCLDSINKSWKGAMSCRKHGVSACNFPWPVSILAGDGASNIPGCSLFFPSPLRSHIPSSTAVELGQLQPNSNHQSFIRDECINHFNSHIMPLKIFYIDF